MKRRSKPGLVMSFEELAPIGSTKNYFSFKCYYDELHELHFSGLVAIITSFFNFCNSSLSPPDLSYRFPVYTIQQIGS